MAFDESLQLQLNGSMANLHPGMQLWPKLPNHFRIYPSDWPRLKRLAIEHEWKNRWQVSPILS